MMLQGMALMQKEGLSFMQIFKPQQSTDTFVERVFVNYQCEPLSMSMSHLLTILKEPYEKNKPHELMKRNFPPVFYRQHANIPLFALPHQYHDHFQ